MKTEKSMERNERDSVGIIISRGEKESLIRGGETLKKKGR